MTRSTNSKGLSTVTMTLVLALGLMVVVVNVGCDEAAFMPPVGGSGDLQWSNALGTYVSNTGYWPSWGFGIQNVPSWGGLVDPWYTSALGLPRF